MRRTIQARVLGLLIATAVLAACGGGGGGAPGAGDGAPQAGMTLFPKDVRVNEYLDIDVQYPRICAHDDLVYVTWTDPRHGGSSVYFNRSTDGGKTWSPTDTRLDRSPAAVPTSKWPLIACDRERVYVVWHDQRSGQVDLYLNRSEDGGVNWLTNDVRLDGDAPGAADSVYPRMECGEDSVYIVWEEYRRSMEDVHFSASHDGGQTWSVSDVRLNEDREVLEDTHAPAMCFEGHGVYVHWSQSVTGKRDIIGRSSSDGGLTWNPERQVNRNAPATSWSWLARAAAPGGGTVHAVWHDNRSDGGVSAALGRDIYYHRSADGGASWGAADVRLNLNPKAAQSIGAPRMCASDQNVFVGWFHLTSAIAPRIRARRSHDGGQTWTPAEEDIISGPVLPPNTQNDCAIGLACDQGHVFVAWNDNRAAISYDDIYLNYTSWTGSFQKADLRLNTPPAGTTSARQLDLCTSGGAAFVVWVDDRDGNQGIYINVLRP